MKNQIGGRFTNNLSGNPGEKTSSWKYPKHPKLVKDFKHVLAFENAGTVFPVYGGFWYWKFFPNLV